MISQISIVRVLFVIQRVRCRVVDRATRNNCTICRKKSHRNQCPSLSLTNFFSVSKNDKNSITIGLFYCVVTHYNIEKRGMLNIQITAHYPRGNLKEQLCSHITAMECKVIKRMPF